MQFRFYRVDVLRRLYFFGGRHACSSVEIQKTFRENRRSSLAGLIDFRLTSRCNGQESFLTTEAVASVCDLYLQKYQFNFSYRTS